MRLKSKRLLFVVNVAWFFVSHRLSLALSARAAGYDVHVAAAPDDAEALATLRSHGITFHPIRITRSTFRVVDELRALSDLMRLYRSLRPSVVHHVTIKPMLYGSLAARLTSVSPVINAVSGMGYVFTSSGGRAGLRRRLVTLAYRWLFARPGTWVIVQNADDAAFLSDAKIVDPARCVLIRGSGVDLDRFAYLPPPATRPVLVVCPCRMLWDKGVGEFVEAARLLRSWDVDVRCALVGGLDAQNPAAVPEEYLQAAVAAGSSGGDIDATCRKFFRIVTSSVCLHTGREFQRHCLKRRQLGGLWSPPTCPDAVKQSTEEKPASSCRRATLAHWPPQFDAWSRTNALDSNTASPHGRRRYVSSAWKARLRRHWPFMQKPGPGSRGNEHVRCRAGHVGSARRRG